MLTQVPIPVLSDRIGRVLDIGLSLAEAFLQREAYRLAHAIELLAQSALRPQIYIPQNLTFEGRG